MVNKALLLGNVGNNPESKNNVVKFSLATSSKYKDKDETQWHNIVVFGKLAEVAEKYVKKGSKLYVEGRITYNKHEDKYYTSIICDSFKMLDKKETQSSSQQQSNEPFEDDIPF